MKIKWYGHSCFLITTDSGLKIFTDPCDNETGYILHDLEVDVVMSSHDHFDHAYFAAFKGEPMIVNQPGTVKVGDVTITGIASFHDDEKGAQRGPNVIFVLETEGVRVAHMGDLGHQLNADQLSALGRVDVMLLPVGGVFTIDALGAVDVVKAVAPSMVIPMHYQTPDLNPKIFHLTGVQPFLGAMDGFYSIHRLNSSELTLDKSSMAAKRVIVMDYAKCD